MSELLLAPVTGAEAARLSQLHAVCFAEGWTEEAMTSLLKSPGVAAIGASEAGTFVGFVMVRQAADEAEILTLGVAPSHRRQHVAQKLVAYAAAQMQIAGVQSLFLEVAHDNKAAIALYCGIGFVERGKRPGYYRRGGLQIDALIFGLDLGRLS
jgi:ribosomal-protein-alanine N-acetyltransferase